MDVANTEEQTRLPNYGSRRKVSGPVIPRIGSVAKNLVLEFEPLVGYSLLPFCVSSYLGGIAYYRLTEPITLSLARNLERLTSSPEGLFHCPCENSAAEMTDRRLAFSVPYRDAICPSYSSHFFREVNIDDRKFSSSTESTETLRNLLEIIGILDI